MKAMRLILPALACASLMGPAGHAAPESLIGFKSASSAAELESEKTFDASIDPADLRAWLEQMSSGPNQVGSPHDKANAEFMLGKFTEWGWKARIETFYVLYPTPKSVALDLVAPVPYKAKLFEGPITGDRTSVLDGRLPLQRVLRGRGRDGRPDLRELWDARRLRGA